MDYFGKFSSNTCAGSGNQLLFNTAEGETRTGRLYYKVYAPGKYSYSILFSNTVDSTFADGSMCRRNTLGGHWEILEAKAAVCPGSALGEDVESKTAAERINETKLSFVELTFDGSLNRQVKPGEFFHTDPLELDFGQGDYLCLELTFRGEGVPYHEESQLPLYIKGEDGWYYCKHLPFASMLGCDRQIKQRIGFLGDSITQGCGTGVNTYVHWNAVLAEKLGQDYAYWNLGLGYGRASDAATDGVWLSRAKHNDIVVVCYGVNDLLQIGDEQQLKADLEKIVDCLNAAGVKVVLQTIPPFDYEGERIGKWLRVNDYIRQTLSKKAALVFDVVPWLQQDEAHPHMAKFVGHPNEEGCTVWANALYDALINSGLLK